MYTYPITDSGVFPGYTDSEWDGETSEHFADKTADEYAETDRFTEGYLHPSMRCGRGKE
jgi:hypothetical protein